MKKRMMILVLAVGMTVFAGSCTREPLKIERNDRAVRAEESTEESSTLPAATTEGTRPVGKIHNDGVDTERGWGALIPAQ